MKCSGCHNLHCSITSKRFNKIYRNILKPVLSHGDGGLAREQAGSSDRGPGIHYHTTLKQRQSYGEMGKGGQGRPPLI